MQLVSKEYKEAMQLPYAFYTDILVKPGDTVEVGKAQAIVTKVNIPEKEILPFRDELKKIDRKVDDE